MLKRSDLEGLRDELQSPPDPTHWLVLKSEMADYLTALLDRWPEGHVLVPGEPTGYMRACGLSALYSATSFAPAQLGQTVLAGSCYRAMIAAAQEAPDD